MDKKLLFGLSSILLFVSILFIIQQSQSPSIDAQAISTKSFFSQNELSSLEDFYRISEQNSLKFYVSTAAKRFSVVQEELFFVYYTLWSAKLLDDSFLLQKPFRNALMVQYPNLSSYNDSCFENIGCQTDFLSEILTLCSKDSCSGYDDSLNFLGCYLSCNDIPFDDDSAEKQFHFFTDYSSSESSSRSKKIDWSSGEYVFYPSYRVEINNPQKDLDSIKANLKIILGKCKSVSSNALVSCVQDQLDIINQNSTLIWKIQNDPSTIYPLYSVIDSFTSCSNAPEEQCLCTLNNTFPKISYYYPTLSDYALEFTSHGGTVKATYYPEYLSSPVNASFYYNDTYGNILPFDFSFSFKVKKLIHKLTGVYFRLNDVSVGIDKISQLSLQDINLYKENQRKSTHYVSPYEEKGIKTDNFSFLKYNHNDFLLVTNQSQFSSLPPCSDESRYIIFNIINSNSHHKQFFDPVFKQNLVLPQMYRFSFFVGEKETPSLPKEINVKDYSYTTNKSLVSFSLDDKLSSLTLFYDDVMFDTKDSFKTKFISFNLSDDSYLSVDRINWDKPLLSLENGLMYEYLDSSIGFDTYEMPIKENTLYYERDSNTFTVIIDNLSNEKTYYYGFVPLSTSMIRNYTMLQNKSYSNATSLYDVPPNVIESLSLIDGNLSWKSVDRDMYEHLFIGEITYEIYGSLLDVPLSFESFNLIDSTSALSYLLGESDFKHYLVVAKDSYGHGITSFDDLMVI